MIIKNTYAIVNARVSNYIQNLNLKKNINKSFIFYFVKDKKKLKFKRSN